MSFWSDITTYFSDWYKDGVLVEHLTNQAIIHRKPVGEYVPAPGMALPLQPTSDELYEVFMFSGVDYRGQAQHAFETLGYGASANISVDFAKMFLPPGVSMFATASISANMSAKKASHRFLYIANQGNSTEFFKKPNSLAPVNIKQPGFKDLRRARMPIGSESAMATWAAANAEKLKELDAQAAIAKIQTSRHQAWQPVVLSCMRGSWTYCKGGVGVEVGAKFDTTNITNIGISNVESFGFGIKLTASASGSYEGTWVLVTDPAPLHSDIRDTNIKREWFKEYSKSASSQQNQQFDLAVKKLPSQSSTNPSCYLSWWSQTKEATAALNAALTATSVTQAGTYNDQTVGPGGTLTLSAKLPSIKWTSKTASYRLNNPCSNPDIILSQETVILYKQLGGQLIGIALDLELGCATVKADKDTGLNSLAQKDPQNLFLSNITTTTIKKEIKVDGALAPPDMTLYKSDNFKAALSSKSLKCSFFEDKFKKIEKTWSTVNSMTYEAGIVLWSKPDRQLLEGSGFVVGQSLILPTFAIYWNNCTQCDLLFGKALPDWSGVKKLVEDSITEQLPSQTGILPTLQNWLDSSNTGDYRWSITNVDDAIKAYWKHQDKTPWNLAPADVLKALLAQAKKNCGTQNSGTAEEKEKKLYSQVVYLALEEAKIRAKLYNEILQGINKWIKSKGGETTAVNNKRYPAILSLRLNCAYSIEKLDDFTSKLDVVNEYNNMRAMEVDLSGQLHVSLENLQTFLGNVAMQECVKDLVALLQHPENKKQVPGAFIIEASFKLSSEQLSLKPGFVDNGDDIQSGFTDDIKRRLAGHYDDRLQYISIRYRKSDTKASDRSFKLGVNVGAAKLGFSLDRIRQAGTEGNFMLHTVWFGSYKGFNDRGAWPEKSVPMPVIIS